MFEAILEEGQEWTLEEESSRNRRRSRRETCRRSRNRRVAECSRPSRADQSSLQTGAGKPVRGSHLTVTLSGRGQEGSGE